MVCPKNPLQCLAVKIGSGDQFALLRILKHIENHRVTCLGSVASKTLLPSLSEEAVSPKILPRIAATHLPSAAFFKVLAFLI